MVGSISENALRLYGVCSVKKYNESYYELVYHKSVRKKGYQPLDDSLKAPAPSSGGSSPDEKLSQSISRTKHTIKELALCNGFDYFVTLTFRQSETIDRYNTKDTMKKMFQWFKHFQQRKCPDFKYLLIPELHKDGALHFHGLFKGVPSDMIVKNEFGYFTFLPFQKKFGFTSVSPVRSLDKVASYITKYITKDVGTVTEHYGHSYFCSKGLKRAEVIVWGDFDVSAIQWDYVQENGYCKIKKFCNSDFLAELTLN